MKKVAVLLADGFEEIEALTVVDILRRASVYVDTVSITDEYKVRGSHGINVQTEDLFDEVNFVEFDMIVLPGGMPGTTNLDEHPGCKESGRGLRDIRQICSCNLCSAKPSWRYGTVKGKTCGMLSVGRRQTVRRSD